MAVPTKTWETYLRGGKTTPPQRILWFTSSLALNVSILDQAPRQEHFKEASLARIYPV